MKTPITIITGYLGSGKTTLLKKIINESTQKLAIIMNEFGEINIDGKIIKGKNVDISELQGGCVCCSLTGEFEEAVKEIIQKVKPDAIVVETTGVAEPEAIVIDVQENLPDVRLDSVVTIVDSDAVIKFPAMGHTGKMQIEIADTILLNKTDIINKKQLASVENKIKSINNKATILKTIKCNVNINYLFGINAKKSIKKHEKHEIRESFFSFETDKKISKEKFEKLVKNIPKDVYRAKGFINTDKGSFLFNYVNGRYDFENFNVKKTELVFIGEKIQKYKEKIIGKLKDI